MMPRSTEYVSSINVYDFISMYGRSFMCFLHIIHTFINSVFLQGIINFIKWSLYHIFYDMNLLQT